MVYTYCTLNEPGCSKIVPQRLYLPSFGLYKPLFTSSYRRNPSVKGLEGVEGLGMTEAMQEAAEISEVADMVGDFNVQNVELGEVAVVEDAASLPSGILEEPLLDEPDNLDKEQVFERTKSLVLLNIMTFLMASNNVVVKNAEAFIDPFTFSALRFLISCLAFAPFLSSNGIKVLDKKTVVAGVEIGLWSTLGYLFQTIGLEHTDASKAAFLGGLFVVFVPCLAGLTGKGISRVTWAGTMVSLAGTSLLEQGSKSPFGIGDFFCLLSAVFFAVQILRTEGYSKALPQDSGLCVLAVSTLTICITSTALAIAVHPSASLALAHAFFGDSARWNDLIHHAMGLPWHQIFYTGVFSTSLVLFIEMTALRHVTSADAAIIYTIQPVLSGALAFFFLGEHWTPPEWAGAAVILAASLGTQLLGSSSKEPITGKREIKSS